MASLSLSHPMSLSSQPSCVQQIELANQLLKKERLQEIRDNSSRISSMEKVCDDVLVHLGTELVSNDDLCIAQAIETIRDPHLMRRFSLWMLQQPWQLSSFDFTAAIRQLKRLHLFRSDRSLAGPLMGRFKILAHERKRVEQEQYELKKIGQILATYQPTPEAELNRLREAGIPVDQLKDDDGYIDERSKVVWAREFELARFFSERGYRVMASGQSSYYEMLGDLYQTIYRLKCCNRSNSLHRPQRWPVLGPKVAGLPIHQIWETMAQHNDLILSNEVICCSVWLADWTEQESAVDLCHENTNMSENFTGFIPVHCTHGDTCEGSCTELLHPLNELAVDTAQAYHEELDEEGSPGIINLFAFRPNDLERFSKQTHYVGFACNNAEGLPKAGEELYVEVQYGEAANTPQRARRCPEHHGYMQRRLAAFHLPRRVRIIRITDRHPTEPASRATLLMELIATIQHFYDRAHVGLTASKQYDLVQQLVKTVHQIPTLVNGTLELLTSQLNNGGFAAHQYLDQITVSSTVPMELDDSKSSSTDRGDSKSASRV